MGRNSLGLVDHWHVLLAGVGRRGSRYIPMLHGLHLSVCLHVLLLDVLRLGLVCLGLGLHGGKVGRVML